MRPGIPARFRVRRRRRDAPYGAGRRPAARPAVDADGRRACCSRTADGATWPRAARDGWARRMTLSPASPTAWGHGARHGSRGPARHQHDRRSTAITQLSGPRQAGTRRCRGPSVAVREIANGAHRPFKGTNPVHYTSVDTATQRPAALQGDTPRDREKTARIAENFQLAGRFRRWWQVLGSNQRRLSRRFYRPLRLSSVFGIWPAVTLVGSITG